METDARRLVFETHATSYDNEADLASGHYDVDLSPIGEQQAAALGIRYALDLPSLVVASDLRRSWRTADIAFGTRVPVKTLYDYLAAGDPLDDFLNDFPSVTREQAIAALELAREMTEAHATTAR